MNHVCYRSPSCRNEPVGKSKPCAWNEPEKKSNPIGSSDPSVFAEPVPFKRTALSRATHLAAVIHFTPETRTSSKNHSTGSTRPEVVNQPKRVIQGGTLVKQEAAATHPSDLNQLHRANPVVQENQMRCVSRINGTNRRASEPHFGPRYTERMAKGGRTFGEEMADQIKSALSAMRHSGRESSHVLMHPMSLAQIELDALNVVIMQNAPLATLLEGVRKIHGLRVIQHVRIPYGRTHVTDDPERACGHYGIRWTENGNVEEDARAD